MTIFVFSDSHGDVAGMTEAVRRGRPDLILHLGDHVWDAEELGESFPEIPLRKVKGNCDRDAHAPLSTTFFYENKKIIMTHGHIYNVKVGYEALLDIGREYRADILLFGHTHRAYYIKTEKMHVLNPGSIGRGSPPSYGIIKIEGSEISCELIQTD